MISRESAIQLMLKGKKVTHTTFTDEEWVTMEGNKIKSEEGYKHDAVAFWQGRTHHNFSHGWSEWKEPKVEA